MYIIVPYSPILFSIHLIFSNPYTEPYINENYNEDKDTREPKIFIEAKYDLLRSLFFIVAKQSKKSISFKDIAKAVGVWSLRNPNKYLVQGYLFGKRTINLFKTFIRNQKLSLHRTLAIESVARYNRLSSKYLPQLVGTKSHAPMELYFMISLKLKGILKGIFSEQHPRPNIRSIVDLYIKRTPEFISEIERPSGLHFDKDIKTLVVDFSRTLPLFDDIKIFKDPITVKFWKEYQGKERFFYTVLTHPDASEIDVKNYERYLRRMPASEYPQNVKVLLLKDFIALFRVVTQVLNLINELLDLVEDCLQMEDLDRQEEALNELQELYEKARYYLRFPLS